MFGGRSYTARIYFEKSRSRDTILYGELWGLRAGLIAGGLICGGPLVVGLVYAMFHPDPKSALGTGVLNYVLLNIFLLFASWICFGMVHRGLSPWELSLDRSSRVIRFSSRPFLPPFLRKRKITLFEASEVQALTLSSGDPSELELVLTDGGTFPVDRCTDPEDLKALARDIADTLGVPFRDSSR